MKQRRSLVGQRFDRLVVVDLARIVSRQSKWNCICDCGNSHEVLSTHLTRGLIRSCGCLQRSFHIKHGRKRRGCSYDRAYGSWSGMIQRCTNPKNDRWKSYGGRGITVCERWRKFENFLADMGERPIGYSLDRRNNEGNYEPSNCYWATPKQQSNNMRGNVLIEHEGRQQTFTQWAREANIHPSTLRQRLKNGWDFSTALNTPVQHRFANKRTSTRTDCRHKEYLALVKRDEGLEAA